jgi:hypothetical protein
MSTTQPQRKQLKNTNTNQKDRLRDKCFNRVRNQRQNILGQLRDKQRTVSEQEKDQLDREFIQNKLQSIIQECNEEFDDDLLNTDEYWELYVQLQKEIDEAQRKEELDILYDGVDEEFEANARFEQMMFESQLDDVEECVVICPVCKQNQLLHTQHALFCRCGLRIKTEVCYTGLFVNYCLLFRGKRTNTVNLV